MGDFAVINDGPVIEVPLGKLTIHPRNVNEGDLGAIGASIEAHGFYGAVVVQRSTGRILAGNHRYLAAQQSGAQTLPVQYVDVDDETALRILIADNRTTRLGRDEPEGLAALLTELAQTPAGLEGIGYDGDDLDTLLADLHAPPPLVNPPAGDDSAALTATWAIVVNCRDESEQAVLLERFIAEGLPCRALTG